ncbi:hypothetical protein E3N88_10167 [Mikania micrantha]|uniref:Uncharacterized protein n=1 Tax=Mikania micrantha TaxID=192012 RepID=A0A5N6PCQ6_9ASTR|nr:hypothetical protein E3N88_10167 [Mikania micrantha]
MVRRLQATAIVVLTIRSSRLQATAIDDFNLGLIRFPVTWNIEFRLQFQSILGQSGMQLTIRFSALELKTDLSNSKINDDLVFDGKKYKFQGVVSGPQKSSTFQHLEVEVDNSFAVASELQSLITKYDKIFAEPTQLPPNRYHTHSITLLPNTTPPNIRPYRYPHSQKNEIEKQVQQLLTWGFIQPSTSPFSSPVLLVRKKDQSWRLCVDYRALNKIIVADNYPISNIDELLDELYGAKVFSKLDLRSGYYQVQVTMNLSKDMDQHIQHLETTLQLLQHHQFFAKLSKCCFGQTKVIFLGHVVTAEGVQVEEEKIYVVKSCPFQVQLNKSEAFNALKEDLMCAHVLRLPDFSKLFVVECDASSDGVGAILSQDEHPIAYFSKGFSPSNRFKSAYDRELLALILAIQNHKAGKENRGADALSRRPTAGELLTHSTAYCFELGDIREGLGRDPYTSDHSYQIRSYTHVFRIGSLCTESEFDYDLVRSGTSFWKVMVQRSIDDLVRRLEMRYNQQHLKVYKRRNRKSVKEADMDALFGNYWDPFGQPVVGTWGAV